MHRLGVEFAISRSQVWRPNHYTTEQLESCLLVGWLVRWFIDRRLEFCLKSYFGPKFLLVAKHLCEHEKFGEDISTFCLWLRYKHSIRLLISAPSYRVYYFLSVDSVCLFVTLLQIASSFLFLDGIEPFFGRQLSMWHCTNLCSLVFDLGPLAPKIWTKSPIRVGGLAGLVVWLSGNALVAINEVTLRQARLILGWVHHLGM